MDLQQQQAPPDRIISTRVSSFHHFHCLVSFNHLHTHTGLQAFSGQRVCIIKTIPLNGHSGRRGDEQIDRRRVEQLSCQSGGSQKKSERPELHLSHRLAASNQALPGNRIRRRVLPGPARSEGVFNTCGVAAGILAAGPMGAGLRPLQALHQDAVLAPSCWRDHRRHLDGISGNGRRARPRLPAGGGGAAGAVPHDRSIYGPSSNPIGRRCYFPSGHRGGGER